MVVKGSYRWGVYGLGLRVDDKLKETTGGEFRGI